MDMLDRFLPGLVELAVVGIVVGALIRLLLVEWRLDAEEQERQEYRRGE